MTDMQSGYYTTRNPIGLDGDFITAPEVSQMFGELLGLWCVVSWRQLGAPTPFNLIELGPGRGTLMNDLFRSALVDPEFCNSAELHFVEIGSKLRESQKSMLGERSIIWHNDINSLPSGASIILANEFFDVLPIKQYQLTAKGWCERKVDFVEGEFRLILDDTLTTFVRKGVVGDIFERALERELHMSIIAGQLREYGGAALIIDYGYSKSTNGDTLQAVRKQKAEPVFANPGLADLTSHVDFESLVRVVDGVKTFGPTTQRDFLLRLGIEARSVILKQNATSTEARDIAIAYNRLVDKCQMGELFKVLALSSHDVAIPPGFEHLHIGLNKNKNVIL